MIPKINVTKLDAEQAIVIARSEIDEAKELGANVTEAEKTLENAREFLENEKYQRAYDEAIKAQDIAYRLKQEILSSGRLPGDARSAITRAEDLIKRAEELGGDVLALRELLSEAKISYQEENYYEAIEKADSAADLAQDIILMITSQKYIIGTWEVDKDCLWNIADKKRFYNDPWRWKKIYKANRKRISDPNIIHPGQLLIIPGE
ncbi:LysM peptidoglycan-binding domain-containing protein [Elusimicrobiota bacterium]